jgi:tetratricopeptide (TPR) repeat protein
VSYELRCPTGEDTDHVHRYVAGTLSPDELESFEVHLLECDECQRGVREGTAIRTALVVSGAPAEERSPARPWRLAGSLAIAAAAAIALWFVLPGGEVEALGRIGSPPGMVPLPVRAADADSAAALADRGMAAYRDGDYRAAARFLERSIELEAGPGPHFFLGIARLMNGSRTAALESLRAALEPPGNPYAAEAHFYQAKAWLLAGQADSALAHLGAVPPSAGAVHAHAQALADSVRRAVR